jgi:hypothetical protein
MCSRDDRGSFVAGQATWYDRAACKDGLKLAERLGFQRINVETDCLQFVQLWRKRELQQSLIDAILKEIDEDCLAF